MVGDSVCVLLGAGMLFMLRAREDCYLVEQWALIRRVKKRNVAYLVYRFLGETHVNRIMMYNRDIKRDIKEAKIELKDFWLRSRIPISTSR